MSEDKKINAAKISDEDLDGVNGGVMIRTDLGSAGKAGNAVYNMNENAGLHTALKDDTMNADPRLMSNGIRSGKPKHYANDPRGNIQNA
ncbi:MAG: hypothetical protein K5847_09850 [Lachnospiraceae bacterium]|nr:hypothetical protein [Lachnospiraceae bacterium]